MTQDGKTQPSGYQSSVETVQRNVENLEGRVVVSIHPGDAPVMAGMLRALLGERRDLRLLQDLAMLLERPRPFRSET